MMKKTKIYAAAAMFCATIEGVAAQTWVYDDERTEITPVYLMVHKHGDDFTQVRANFWFVGDRKSVRLKPGNAVEVNGVQLDGEAIATGYSYLSKIPLNSSKLVFRFSRDGRKIHEHIFELPKFELLEAPKKYYPYESVKIVFRRQTEVAGVESIRLSFDIPDLEFPFGGVISGSTAELKPIFKLPLPTGSFPAEIFLQRRIPLAGVSEGVTSGWAVATYKRHFPIDIEKQQIMD
jgi:hypothetical protein